MSGRLPPSGGSTKAVLAAGVLARPEAFGYVVYVPERDHFFALGGAAAAALDAVRRGAPPGRAARALAEFGILARSPDVPARPHYGRSLLGRLPEPLTVTEPLVVNCFATAHCPLRCRYCHADDLMQPARRTESDDEPWLVARMAAAVPAMVAVVTGGEPLYAPWRTEVLVKELASTGKAVVLDTSGVGELAPLLPVLHEHRVHLRISLDSLDPAANDRLRPINRRYLPLGTSSGATARQTLAAAAAAGLPTTVQTVVTSANENPDTLRAMRDGLVRLGVGNWVLHVMVPAGKAAAPRNQDLRPGPRVLAVLAELVRTSCAERVPLNIRVTGTHHAPNSVLLVGSGGDLYVEGASGGKVRVAGPGATRDEVVRAFRRHVNLVEHVSRYLNGSIRPVPRWPRRGR